MDRKFMYYGGILSPIFFVLVDIIGGMITPDYSRIINAVSELTQAGSENIYLLSSLFFISAVMGIGFGIGIVTEFSYSRSKLIFSGGILIIINGIFSGLTGTIFPMDPFNVDITFAGTLHIILTALNALMIMLLIPMMGIGFYKERQWVSFRLYSIITLLIIVIFGGSTPVLMMNDIGLLGLFERIVIYSYLLWFFVLAFKLIRDHPVMETQ
ncbi:MAG: DUF998 domain-containing protein [Methanosarcinales archaeon]|nr:DUF998 domain-containing protein [Methanosarcinales archaeon]MCD4815976.1 DUF998 domain-containing protein [Methanosarcinales archaeon]